MSRWRRQLHRRHRIAGVRRGRALRRIAGLIADNILDHLFRPSLFPRLLVLEDGTRTGLSEVVNQREWEDVRRGRQR